MPETEIPGITTGEIRLDWPEVSEIDVVRHYTRVSQKNHAIDINFYPLGSCTMKYNPKINEAVARYAGFANAHPLQDESTVQGSLELMYDLQQMLANISGFRFGDIAASGRRSRANSPGCSLPALIISLAATPRVKM